MEQKYDEEAAETLCTAIKNHMVEAARTNSEKEKVKDATVQNLILGLIQMWINGARCY